MTMTDPSFASHGDHGHGPGAPTSRALHGSFARTSEERLLVGVADAIASTETGKSLMTYALGSCIGVTVYDPLVRVGGLLHFMLPESRAAPEKAAATPAMFADTGLPLLLERIAKLGADRRRLVVCAAGGAAILGEDDHFRIGARNRTMLRKLFWQQNLLLNASDTGGCHSRILSLALADGTVTVRAQGKETTLWRAA
jgi:chemotaxis protein CheD